MPLKLPRHYSDGSLENLLRPSGLQAMNAQQQYQKLVSMRAQTAQMNREDNALREYQRMQGGGASQADINEMSARQRRELEMSDVQLQGRPFTPDIGVGGYITSGAERAGAMTQARRGTRQAQIGGGGRAAPPAARPAGVPPPVAPRRGRGLGLAGIFGPGGAGAP